MAGDDFWRLVQEALIVADLAAWISSWMLASQLSRVVASGAEQWRMLRVVLHFTPKDRDCGERRGIEGALPEAVDDARAREVERDGGEGRGGLEWQWLLDDPLLLLLLSLL